eukprot:SAG31_NODE_1215_length_9335_cov_5.846470_1_plen_229_part_00
MLIDLSELASTARARGRRRAARGPSTAMLCTGTQRLPLLGKMQLAALLSSSRTVSPPQRDCWSNANGFDLPVSSDPLQLYSSVPRRRAPPRPPRAPVSRPPALKTDEALTVDASPSGAFTVSVGGKRAFTHSPADAWLKCAACVDGDPAGPTISGLAPLTLSAHRELNGSDARGDFRAHEWTWLFTEAFPLDPFGCKGCYFLVFVPTIREIRDFNREIYGTNRESVIL